ncbi:hypothetical protein E1B28_005188 [Marasmius oreades]|uniref:Uncharacterized protein n=1 Tax=Marasmius oreades TaxID=181124 RepID=A0A9P7V084_9AGAR|nr:uncharacterized protein E1B28_005188 [Marasmius oreades]KAG7097877.1 hypothetical protein E1B28_005188 [Marasmius oreades]
MQDQYPLGAYKTFRKLPTSLRVAKSLTVQELKYVPEATQCSVLYSVERMIAKVCPDNLTKPTLVAISDVARYTLLKALELAATIVSLSSTSS